MDMDDAQSLALGVEREVIAKFREDHKDVIGSLCLFLDNFWKDFKKIEGEKDKFEFAISIYQNLLSMFSEGDRLIILLKMIEINKDIEIGKNNILKFLEDEKP